MDNRRDLEEQKILLAFRQRQLQLDLEEFELNKKLALLKDETHVASSPQRLSKEESNINQFLTTTPKEQHVVIDLTVDDIKPSIKVEPPAADNSDTSKAGLSTQMVGNSQTEDSTPKHGSSLALQTDPSPSIQTSGDSMKADEQPQRSNVGIEIDDTTATSEVAATPDRFVPLASVIILSTATSQPKPQQGSPDITHSTHDLLLSSEVPPNSAQPQTKRKHTSNPRVKRKADQLSNPTNPEKASTEKEEHPAGLGPRKAARLQKALPKNNRLHRGSYVGRTPIFEQIEREHNAVLARFCANFFPDLLSDSWTSDEVNAIRSIRDEIRPAMALLEFESMEEFAGELRNAAEDETPRVEAGIKNLLKFFQSEWQLCWDECRKKETHVERLDMAASWIRDVDREFGIGP